MTNLNILIVEGNDPKNNEFFKKAAKASCSENLKKLVLKLRLEDEKTLGMIRKITKGFVTPPVR